MASAESQPIVLSTWSFGRVANQAAWPVLEAGGSSLDAVEAGCRAVEADPAVDTVGVGGLPDRTGQVSLDACVMVSPDRCGGVCFVRNYPHPVSIARAVMEGTPHVMLAGEGAERFAAEQGFDTAPLLSEAGRQRLAQWERNVVRAGGDRGIYSAGANVEEGGAVDPNRFHDTVGVLALDREGQLAGACSTSGQPFKLPGRVGDSPIIGQGLYVHPEHGAAVATGTGELVMGVCGSFLAVEQMRRGATPLEAGTELLERVQESYTVD
ncbi:MAG: N(4)-(beta-N-acetylglucosaminyl)-L-asparaginase, partial [Phycisphaerae bacterium]|nr:N(4)-(beta-N-acetylglucosaminyl)-L-asparaginase [Phycisphaerae bacterium]